MTTPTTPAAVLRELHRLRRHAAQLKDEIDRLPRQLKAQQAKVTRQEEAIKQTQEIIKKLKVAASDKEKSIKAKHQEIAKHEKQRNEATGKKEYDALGAEIVAAREACTKLEEEALLALTEVDEQTARIPELDKALKQAQHEVANFDSTCKQRQGEMGEEYEKALAQIKEVETAMPADIRGQYDRLVAARGEDAMSSVVDRICQACYTSITAQQYNELIQGMFVFCKSCGRYLYLPE
jgi:predicted  nucleic acid-binding Zn-ribbon protein